MPASDPALVLTVATASAATSASAHTAMPAARGSDLTLGSLIDLPRRSCGPA